ncbi:thermonuclease family protein [Microbispora sp. CA-102843]|uniref:thermonuclease family protein n=1 Tax=Microbispora sp. CA-102843 TaxID=3239952 RepID=UPI003D942BC1
MRFPSHALAVLATAALAVPVAASTSAFAAATASPSPTPSQTQTPATTSPSPSPQPTVTVTRTITPKAAPKGTKTTTAKTARPKTVPKDAVQVTVKKIVDGDTADVVTTSGRTVRIGLLEADAPGKGGCWSQEAAARLKALLPPGKAAYVRAAEQVPEKERILIYLWSSTGVYVNGDMVRSGLAQTVNSFPEHSYTQWQYNEQVRAQMDKLGLWSGCWAADTYDRRSGVQTPSGTGGGALTPAPIEPEDAAPAPPGTTYSPEPIPQGSTAGTVAVSPSPTPSPSPSPGGSTDPRYNTCEEAIAHGYGPYYRGTDPEYDWYIDRDSDGKVCER